MKLTPAQIARHAYAAGFRGTALRNAVAVALAESGGNPRAVGVNSDRWRSRDRGLWQINDHWHPEVSDAQAFNPATAARHAFRISSGGKSWKPWSTWKNGSAQTQFARAQIGVNQFLGSSNGTAGVSETGEGGTTQNVLLGIPGTPSTGEVIGGIGKGLAGLLGGAADGGLVDGVPDPLDVLGAGGDLVKLLTTPVTLAVKTGAWLSDSHNWQRVAMVAGGSAGILIALGIIARSGAAGDAVKSAASPSAAIGKAVSAGLGLASGGTATAAKAGVKSAAKSAASSTAKTAAAVVK